MHVVGGGEGELKRVRTRAGALKGEEGQHQGELSFRILRHRRPARGFSSRTVVFTRRSLIPSRPLIPETTLARHRTGTGHP